MKNLFVFIFLLMLFTTIVFPHGGKDHKKEKAAKQDTSTIVSGDAIAINGGMNFEL